ncbi:XRE family transcriptional regulator [Roseburia sp. AF20-18LB]|nr:XRE family transcriptional regulator [Roseburia sp. AF20-18LB]
MNEKVVVMANRIIDEENVKIGRLLQNARESHGVLQSELCEATGLTKNHISAVERGVSKASIRMLLGYCEKIGITPNDILGYSELNLIPELQEMINHMDIEQQKCIMDMIELMSK